MGNACSICANPNRATIEAEAGRGSSNRAIAAQFGIARSSLGRHLREHVAAPTSTPGAGTHRRAADALVAEVLAVIGEPSAQDEAEARYLEALADAVDASPANPSLLRELRLTLAAIRKTIEPPDEEADELSALFAGMSFTTDEASTDMIRAAAVAAGVAPELAEKIAREATGAGPAESWHETMARLHPERAALYREEEAAVRARLDELGIK